LLKGCLFAGRGTTSSVIQPPGHVKDLQKGVGKATVEQVQGVINYR